MEALDFSEFTAFMVWDLDASVASDTSLEKLTLLSVSGLEIGVEGLGGTPLYPLTLQAEEDDRVTTTGLLATGAVTQSTVRREASRTMVSLSDNSLFGSADRSVETSADGFLAIGARAPLGDGADQFFKGVVHEVVLYNESLDSRSVQRVEDYQKSRWEGQLVWDHSLDIAGVTITGAADVPNIISGGWGIDELRGGDENDTLRGGPGDDLLEGSGGADRFQFFSKGGTDMVDDFDESEGDLIDLSPIFGSTTGDPDDYLALVNTIEFPPNSNPISVTTLRLFPDGDAQTGGDHTQAIVINGSAAQLAASDLPRLVGEGRIFLGGLQYPMEIVSSATTIEMTEVEVANAVYLTRSGNTDAAVTVDVLLGGEATPGFDYLASGSGSYDFVRSVSFAAGETEASLVLTPQQDTEDEPTESVELSIYPVEQVTSSTPGTLALSIAAAPRLYIEAVVPYAVRSTGVPGLIRIWRDGDVSLGQPVELQLAGSGAVFEDYTVRNQDDSPVSTNIEFAPGQSEYLLYVYPEANAFGATETAEVSLVANPQEFILISPWSAAVAVVESEAAISDDIATITSEALFENFDAFLIGYFGSADRSAVQEDLDGDSFSSVIEYATGTDPTSGSSFDSPLIESIDDRIVITFNFRSVFDGDIDFALDHTIDLVSYEDVSAEFDLVSSDVADDVKQAVWTSHETITEMGLDRGFYSVRTLVEGAQLPGEIDDMFAIGDAGQLLSQGDASWEPTAGLIRTPSEMENGQTAIIKAFVSGAFEIEFDWALEAGGSNDLVFMVDGVEVERLSAETTTTTVNHIETQTGSHVLTWIYTSGSGQATLSNVDLTQ